jgi:hypothetical protein
VIEGLLTHSPCASNAHRKQTSFACFALFAISEDYERMGRESMLIDRNQLEMSRFPPDRQARRRRASIVAATADVPQTIVVAV